MHRSEPTARMVVNGVEWTLRFDDEGTHHWEAPGISEGEKEEASIDIGQLAQAPSPCLDPEETSFSDQVPQSIRISLRQQVVTETPDPELVDALAKKNVKMHTKEEEDPREGSKVFHPAVGKSTTPPLDWHDVHPRVISTFDDARPSPVHFGAHSLQSSGVGTPEEPKGSLTTTTTSRLQALPDPTPTEDRAHSLQSSGVGIPVEVKDRPTSTPTSRIQALLDPTVLVCLGFKVRPLRDGGGKPSPGRQPPPLRKPPPVLVELGKKILALASPWSTKVFDSIHKQEGSRC